MKELFILWKMSYYMKDRDETDLYLVYYNGSNGSRIGEVKTLKDTIQLSFEL